MNREIDVGKHTTNNNGILSNDFFKAYQELIRESIASDPSGGTYIVDELSHAVHEGRAYVVTAEGTLTAGSSVYILGRTGPSPTHFHGFKLSTSNGKIETHMHEAPTVTATGTQITPINKNRESSNVAGMLVYAGATVSAEGLVLDHDHMYDTGGVGSNLVGGTGNLDEDWVLSPNTDYTIKIANLNTVSVSFVGKFTWSED